MSSFRVEDLFLHGSLEALAASIRHSRVVWVCSRPDEDSNTYRAVLWLLDLGTRHPPEALTSPDLHATAPALSPDGTRVAFLGRRDDDRSQQLHVIDAAGGEARRITHIDRESLTGIEDWSPDGKRLLVGVSVPFAEDDRDDPDQPDDERPIVARIEPYKLDGTGPLVGKRRHLRAVDVETGQIAKVTHGDHDVSTGRWSPDGRRLAFVRTREGRQRHLRDLWIADADGSGARCITRDFAMPGTPRWSPDGRRIAFGGSRTPGDSISRLWLLDVDDGTPRPATGDDLHLEGDEIVWHPAGDRIAVVASVRGMQEIAVVHVDDGRLRPFARRLRQVQALAASRDGLVYASTTMRWPVELRACSWDDDAGRRLTSVNRAWASRRDRPRVSVRRFAVPDGDGGTERIDAWILRPADGGEGPFPVLMDMHGGPQTAVMVDFPNHVYWYALCAKGWMVVAPNTVGSSGYGTDFARRLRGRWGELDLPQYLAILDTLRREGLADHRVACAGKSYGGFLSAWAVGHSAAFRAAVISAPVANVESHAGTSDTGYYVSPYAMDAEIDEDRARYRRLSPVAHCAGTSCATLLLQGQDDQRCPVGQSEELFATLVRHAQGPCTMVVYPKGSHGMAATGNPRHRVDYHQRIVDWLTAHVANAEP
ncbi:MAG: S9 family peptidase [Lysobacteraceae bacterium]